MIGTRSTAVLEEDIERLKDWLLMQPHLPHDVDREVLSSFVYGTKSLEIAKNKIDAYFTVRTREPKTFEFIYRDPLAPEYKKASHSFKKFYLPGETPEGYKVSFQSTHPNYLEFYNNSQDHNRNIVMLELALILYPTMKGLYLVIDAKNLSAAILPRMNPLLVASAMHLLQSAFPFKPKKIIIFNAKPFMDLMLNKFFKPFIKTKLYNRLFVTADDESCLKQFIPETMIPSDYGGLLKSTSDELDEEFTNIVEEHRSWLEKTSKQLVDEKKRPADSKATYGVEGTFRSLALD